MGSLRAKQIVLMVVLAAFVALLLMIYVQYLIGRAVADLRGYVRSQVSLAMPVRRGGYGNKTND